MDAYPREAWLRLGQLLQQRRPQLDTRYRIRRVFAKEHGLTDKTVQEIENAYRDTFSPVMLSTIESAYQVKTGSIEQALAGGELEPLEPVGRISQVRLTAPEPPDDGLRIERLNDRHLQVGLMLDTEATMEDVRARLGELNHNEQAMVSSMQAMETPPAAIGGAVLMLRKLRAEDVEQKTRRDA